MKKCLVVDQSYMARSIITSERAFVIYFKGNAEIVESHKETFGLVNPKLEIYKPSIIRVPSYIKTSFNQKVPLTRQNVFKRDGYTCVYCGCKKRKTLTIDHLIPKAKGGRDSFDNWVTACFRCNNEKADLTLEEYGKEIPKPQRPHYLMLMRKTTEIYNEWKPYLFF